MRWPFLSMPSHWKATSRLMLRIALVACTMTTSLLSRSFDRHAVDFFEARQTVSDFFQARSAQIPDAFFGGLYRDVHGVAAGHDDALDLFADFHDLVDADAALIAVGAAAAALGTVNPDAMDDVGILKALFAQRFGRDIERRFALRAQSPRETLGDDQTHGGGDGIGLDAHVDQARQGLRRIVGVQG